MKVRHSRKQNCVLTTRYGEVQVGEDGWVLNDVDFDPLEKLLELPNFVDGEIYPPRQRNVAASSSANFDEKYKVAMIEAYSDPDNYNSRGKVLMATLNNVFGRRGLPLIGSKKVTELVSQEYEGELLEDVLERITSLTLSPPVQVEGTPPHAENAPVEEPPQVPQTETVETTQEPPDGDEQVSSS